MVHFVPFSDNVSLHGPVIHKISSHIGSPVIGRCCPTQHHVVFNSLQQGHASGPPRDSWKEKQPHMTTMPSLYDLTPLICTQGSSWTRYMLCPHQPQSFRNVRYNRWSTYAVSKKRRGGVHYKDLRHPVQILVRVMLFRTQSFSLYHGHVPKGNPEELAKGLYKGKANITGIKHDLILSFAGLVMIIAAKCMQGCQYKIWTQPQEIKGRRKCEFRHRCVMLYQNEKVERCKLRQAEDMMIETPSLDKEICRTTGSLQVKLPVKLDAETPTNGSFHNHRFRVRGIQAVSCGVNGLHPENIVCPGSEAVTHKPGTRRDSFISILSI